MTQAPDVYDSGFPAGYFIIKSAANEKVLDVTLDSVEDGTEILLWPEKESSIVESFRNPENNNQVFFIDTSGALCSRSSGHALDIEDNGLVLRHRRPISLPFPNAYAHPLPRFIFSPKTGEISVHFEHDPTYPNSPSNAWKSKTYLLTAIPKRRPRNILDDASEFIASNVLKPISFFTGGPPLSPARPDAVFDAEIDLNEDEVVEEERGEEAEVDDAADPGRKVKLVTVPTAEKEMMDLLLSEKARTRRRWIVTPLRIANKKTNS